MPKIVLRVRQGNNELYVMTRGASGKFEFGDPAHGDEKHHPKKHLVTADSITEAIEFIEKGLHPRMEGTQSGQRNMISPKNVTILEVPE